MTGNQSKYQHLQSVYQPIVDLVDHDILGYEALSRIDGKAPLNLLRESYQDGEVMEFDFACLHSAVKILPKLPPGKLLFLNLEPITLFQAFVSGGLGERFLKKLKPYANRIVLELTEGVRMKDLEPIRKGVAFIRKRKFRVALDDFTDIGPKTFAVSSLKVDYMKIDLALIIGISENKMYQQIVRELVRLANMYGSHLVAEGIENEADLLQVRKMGIRYGQGYYFAKPTAAILEEINKPIVRG
ncbi:MAG TPA: EAL domain-containing protein [Candidatus Omnitrophota bacterium]|nr:EAL domain-containing protein [Candidatus Omnitrophota bacterium]